MLCVIVTLTTMVSTWAWTVPLPAIVSKSRESEFELIVANTEVDIWMVHCKLHIYALLTCRLQTIFHWRKIMILNLLKRGGQIIILKDEMLLYFVNIELHILMFVWRCYLNLISRFKNVCTNSL